MPRFGVFIKATGSNDFAAGLNYIVAVKKWHVIPMTIGISFVAVRISGADMSSPEVCWASPCQGISSFYASALLPLHKRISASQRLDTLTRGYAVPREVWQFILFRIAPDEMLIAISMTVCFFKEGASSEWQFYFLWPFFCNKNFTLRLAKIFDKIEKSAKLNI